MKQDQARASECIEKMQGYQNNITIYFAIYTLEPKQF